MNYTIFDYLDSILFTKKKIVDIKENDQGFNFYMMNRWISMYSTEMAEYINNTSNLMCCEFKTKQEQYNFLYNTIPRLRKRKINYIKKVKDSLRNDSNKSNDIELLAKTFEVSKKEIVDNLKLINDFAEMKS